jgi:hypothetical protein
MAFFNKKTKGKTKSKKSLSTKLQERVLTAEGWWRRETLKGLPKGKKKSSPIMPENVIIPPKTTRRF